MSTNMTAEQRMQRALVAVVLALLAAIVTVLVALAVATSRPAQAQLFGDASVRMTTQHQPARKVRRPARRRGAVRHPSRHSHAIAAARISQGFKAVAQRPLRDARPLAPRPVKTISLPASP